MILYFAVDALCFDRTENCLDYNISGLIVYLDFCRRFLEA